MWNKLSMADRAKYIVLGVQNGITSLDTIKDAYNSYAERGDLYSTGNMVDAVYNASTREEFLGNPSHNYDFTQSEEWANQHGYYPDSRGHRDDRVKKPTHPTHPSRGQFKSMNEYELSDRGMENPNYTLFGMVDNGQDPQATLTYKGSIVLPEITVTPKNTYIHNPYDNINVYLSNKHSNGGRVNKYGGDSQPTQQMYIARNPYLRSIGIGQRPYNSLPTANNIDFYDIETGNRVNSDSADENTMVWVDPYSGVPINANRLFNDTEGNLGLTSTDNDVVIRPYQGYRIQPHPYHDTFRYHKVPVASGVQDDNPRNPIYPFEDGEYFETPQLIGEDNWTDPSENMANYALTGITGLTRGLGAKATTNIIGDLIVGEAAGRTIEEHSQAAREYPLLNPGYYIGVKSFFPGLTNEQLVEGTYKGVKSLYDNTKRALRYQYIKPRNWFDNMSVRSYLKPFKKDFRISNLENRLNVQQKNVKDYLQQMYPDAEISVGNTYISLNIGNSQPDVIQIPIKFNDSDHILKLYGTSNREFNLQSMSDKINPQLEFYDVTQTNKIFTIPYSDNSSMATEIGNKVNEIQKTIGDSGLVGGSSVIYGKNYASGIPRDIELVTTESRIGDLSKAMGATNVQKHGNFGYRFNSSKSYKGEPIDVQVISEINGKAAGPLAHEYYKLLYPEEYKQIIDKAVKESISSGKVIPLEDITFPISADDLYKQITPEIQEKKILQDMFLSDKDKHVSRAYQMLTHPDASVRNKAREAMKEAISTHFDNYELASETYKNLRFDNIEANKEFLKELDLPAEYAENEEIMRNIVDRWHIANTTQSRNTFIKRGSEVYLPDEATLNRAVNSTYAPKNGHSSGIGGNTVVYSGRGGVGGDFGSILQQRLTLNPDKIETPVDLLLQKKKLTFVDDMSTYYKLADLENAARAGAITEEELKLQQYLLAKEKDTPMYVGGAYRDGIYYQGNIIDPVKSRTYPIEGNYDSMAPEVGGIGIPKSSNARTTLDNMGATDDIKGITGLDNDIRVDYDLNLPFNERYAMKEYEKRSSGFSDTEFTRPPKPKRPIVDEVSQQIVKDLRKANNKKFNKKERDIWNTKKLDLELKMSAARRKAEEFKVKVSDISKIGALSTPIVGMGYAAIELINQHNRDKEYNRYIDYLYANKNNLKKEDLDKLRGIFNIDDNASDEAVLKLLDSEYDRLHP